MNVFTYVPDFAYLPDNVQSLTLHPEPLIGVEVWDEGNHRHEPTVCNFIVRDDPLSFADALRSVANALTRRYNGVQLV